MKTMKTFNTKPSVINEQWHVFDATDKVLGRLATEVSTLLQGKHKPIYAKNLITGDHVVVVNASKVKVTGKKLEQKMYYRHSHYPGSLKATPLSKMQEDHPDRVIREAVKGMLPKTSLGRQMLSRLKIYAGELHPHGAQIKDSSRPEIIVEEVSEPVDQVEEAQTKVEEVSEPVDQVEEAQTEVEEVSEPVDQVEEAQTEVEEVSEPVDQVEEAQTEVEEEGK